MDPRPPELERIALPPSAAAAGGDLLIMLAGAYDAPARFLEHDLDTDCRDAGFDAALCLVRTDLNGATDGRMIEALRRQVIDPARTAGVGRIVLGGISIGAMTALQYHDACPADADELLLLAPYPGNRGITAEIAAAGGVRAWQPDRLPPDAGELRSWRALKQLAGRDAVPAWLGYGSDDRFADAHRMMADALPADRVCATPGGHSWPVWRQLWRTWLAAGGGGR
ncbi:MAG: alpha/beta hydrolase [Zoogloeaceae bacterium]|nr:hypothetical protein [Rhodocyclaceae bacterium]MCP5237071.1 alpha/beta hydrolase [Zoogloeaceae bacterium]